MKTVIRLFWLLLLLMSVPVSLRAEPASRLDAVLARGVLRVGTTGDYKPFSYRDPTSGLMLGVEAEMADQLAQALGIKLEFVATSWPRLMQDLADDRFDIAMSGISIDLERQKRAVFSVPYLRDGKTPIVRCEDQERFRTLEQIDRSETRLIVNPGGTNERFARRNLKKAVITVYPDNVGIFDQIVVGNADVMITDAIEARLQERLRPQLCALHPDAPFSVHEKGYLMPRDWVLKAFVDQWLSQAVQDGTVRAAFDKWISYSWESPADDPLPIDRLGRLMQQRLALAADVARSKWNSKASIEDLAREKEIIAALARQGAQLGLAVSWLEKFFQAQIDASKVVQRELHQRWHKAQLGPFVTAPDLSRDIRPRLDALTPRLLLALLGARDDLCGPDRLRQSVAAVRQKLSIPGLSENGAAQAASGLLQDGHCP